MQGIGVVLVVLVCLAVSAVAFGYVAVRRRRIGRAAISCTSALATMRLTAGGRSGCSA